MPFSKSPLPEVFTSKLKKEPFGKPAKPASGFGFSKKPKFGGKDPLRSALGAKNESPR